MPKEFPNEFLERLQMIVPRDRYEEVLRHFQILAPIVLRVNTLKVDLKKNTDFQKIDAVPEAVLCNEQQFQQLKDSGVFEKGLYYRQSLSSMLAVQALDPHPEENILDLCAAPGSKTSQIAARMNNTGSIVAVEAVRDRFYKLKAVLKLLGVDNADCLCLDGRRFNARDGLFDRVLVDAPCSSEGRFKLNEPKSFAYWSPRKIKEMVKKQRGLLMNAGRQLKRGGILVYSTCTFAPEENEGVVDWFLRKNDGQFLIESVSFDGIGTYPAVTAWGKRGFNEQVKYCVRILPGVLAEGFFIAKFKKIM
jgi:16S rRNA (cytosine1407-C5)-methyltransferase